MNDIDPQEFGRLEAEVSGLRRDNDRLMAVLERMEIRLTGIEQRMSEATGGWRMLMLLGGGAAAAGGTLVAVAHKLFKVLG